MDENKSLSKPLQMGVRISCGVYPKMSAPDAIWLAETLPGRSDPPVGRAKGKLDRGRTSDARSCPYADIDTAEVCGIPGGGLSKEPAHKLKIPESDPSKIRENSPAAINYWLPTIMTLLL